MKSTAQQHRYLRNYAEVIEASQKKINKKRSKKEL